MTQRFGRFSTSSPQTSSSHPSAPKPRGTHLISCRDVAKPVDQLAQSRTVQAHPPNPNFTPCIYPIPISSTYQLPPRSLSPVDLPMWGPLTTRSISLKTLTLPLRSNVSTDVSKLKRADTPCCLCTYTYIHTCVQSDPLHTCPISPQHLPMCIPCCSFAIRLRMIYIQIRTDCSDRPQLAHVPCRSPWNEARPLSAASFIFCSVRKVAMRGASFVFSPHVYISCEVAKMRVFVMSLRGVVLRRR